MPRKPGQQSSAIADPSGNDILLEPLAALIDAVNCHNEAFTASRFTAKFHTFQTVGLGNDFRSAKPRLELRGAGAHKLP